DLVEAIGIMAQDHVGRGRGGRRRVRRGGVQETVRLRQIERVVPVIADDLARVVDARCEGAAVSSRILAGTGRGGVDRRVDAPAVEEAVRRVATIDVEADDLTGAVDASGEGALARGLTGKRIVEGGVAAADFDEAVFGSGASGVIPDDLARVVN